MIRKVGFIVYEIKGGEPYYFIGRRPESGIFQYPTGKVEKGESLEEGALRELGEELDPDLILNFVDLKQQFNFETKISKYEEHIYLFQVNKSQKVDQHEFSSHQWLRLHDAIKILTYDTHKKYIQIAEEKIKSGEYQKIFAIIGPSGSGKTTVISEILEKRTNFEILKTYMTRPYKREKDKFNRISISKEEFSKLYDEGKILERNFHDSNWYGTPKKSIEDPICKHKNIIGEIDINGYLFFKSINANIISIFLNSDETDLIERIKLRGGHSQEEIENRLKIAKDEIAKSKDCDYIIENKQGCIKETIDKILNIIDKESA